MKQKLLLKSLVLLFALIAGSSSAWADETITLTATNLELGTSYPDAEQTKSIDGISYKYHYLMKNGSNIQAQATNGYIYNSTAYSQNIKSVAITHSGTARATTIYGSSDGTNWTQITSGSGSITGDFTSGSYKYFKITRGSNAAYWTQIVITLGTADASTVATPAFSPVAGTYNTAQDVNISCTTDGATIHYTMTTDGSTPDDPTESDATYSSLSPISVTISGTTIKAKAFKSGMTASSVTTAIYTIKPNKPTVTAFGPTVTITGDDGLNFYYTTNGDTPTNASTHYTAPFEPGANCTIKARAYDANDNASDVYSLDFVNMPLAPKYVNSNYYVKVTDVSTLENGDAVLIVCESKNVAMSTTQNTNNRAKEDVTISENAINSPSANVQKLVLVKRTEKIGEDDKDVFYFYTGSGYLYAASSSSNYLKTETTPDNNARATISISSGNATIEFTGSNSNNLLKYNTGSSIFSCYGSGQTAVQIYKEVVPATINPTYEWATFSYTKPLDFTGTGVSAYIVTGFEGSAVTKTQVYKVPANTGLLLNGTTDNIPLATGELDDVSANKMVAVTTDETISKVDGKTRYVLADDGFGNAMFLYINATAAVIPAGKAYLEIDGDGARELYFDDTTAINALENATKIDNDAIYDLSGRRVENPTKGIYIINGKKVIFK